MAEFAQKNAYRDVVPLLHGLLATPSYCATGVKDCYHSQGSSNMPWCLLIPVECLVMPARPKKDPLFILLTTCQEPPIFVPWTFTPDASTLNGDARGCQ